MNFQEAERLLLTRRQLLGPASTGIGVAALASLLNPKLFASPALDPMGRPINPKTGGLAELPHFEPKAKRVIFLHQSGAPSQIDLFDYKPKLKDFHGSELPDSVRQGQRITGMTSGQVPCWMSCGSSAWKRWASTKSRFVRRSPVKPATVSVPPVTVVTWPVDTASIWVRQSAWSPLSQSESRVPS